jgi:hypothetical protein
MTVRMHVTSVESIVATQRTVDTSTTRVASRARGGHRNVASVAGRVYYSVTSGNHNTGTFTLG